MTANAEGDSFGQLPEELRITIIKLSPDPWSLRSLAYASPAMGRVLDRYPLEILEAVLDATVPMETHRLMGAVLKARFSRFPASLSEAQKVTKIDSPAVTNEMRSFRLDRAAAAVRSLLATAKNVHGWSHACLEHMIQESLELRPSTLITNGSGRTSREMFENATSEEGFLSKETGPPSWVEEQRMTKAFWRLQFFLELQGAGNEGRLGTYWPRQEVGVLSKSSLDGFYDVYEFEREQILTAYDFFSAVTSRTITLVEAVRHNASGLPAIRWIEGTMPSCHCVEPPSFGPNEDIFSQGREHLDRMPTSYRFYRVMSSVDQWLDGWPPLLGFPFQPWRKYGFAIWDNKRMNDLGMRDPRRIWSFGNYFLYSFRWFSILPKEDLP